MSVPHEMKVLVLLYTPEKKVFVGFIPHDQAGFIDRLRKLIAAKKAGTLQRPMVMLRVIYVFLILRRGGGFILSVHSFS